MEVVLLLVVCMVIAVLFFCLGVSFSEHSSKDVKDSRLSYILSQHGGIYKVIDSYREFLGFVKTIPGADEQVENAFWIRSIIVDMDQMLHQFLTLVDRPSREASKTGGVREFPFGPVEWEGLDEAVSTKNDALLIRIANKAHKYTPNDPITNALQKLEKEGTTCKSCGFAGTGWKVASFHTYSLKIQCPGCQACQYADISAGATGTASS